MKAIRYPDGRVEFDGSPEDIGRVLRAQDRAEPTKPVATDKASTVLAGPREAGTRVPDSMPAKIAAWANAHPGRVFTIAEFSQLLGGADRTRVSSTLSRMARTEKPPVVVLVGRGQYRSVAKAAEGGGVTQ